MQQPRTMTMHQAIAEVLKEEMAADPSIVIWGEATRTKVAADWPELLSAFGERVFNMPIAEPTIVGMAIGASAVGLRPFVDIGFNDLLLRAMDDICNQAAKLRYMTGGNISCPIVVKAEYSIPYTPQQGQFLEEVFFRIPGLRVVAPSNPQDAMGIMRTALRGRDPVVFFEERRLKGLVSDAGYALPFGKANKLIEGEDVTVVSYSKLTSMCVEIANELAPKIKVEVIDLRSLSPLDFDLIYESVRKTRRFLSVELGCRTGGVGAELAASVAEHCFNSLKAPVRRIAAPDSSFPASKALWSYLQPSKSDVAKAIAELMQFGPAGKY